MFNHCSSGLMKSLTPSMSSLCTCNSSLWVTLMSDCLENVCHTVTCQLGVESDRDFVVKGRGLQHGYCLLPYSSVLRPRHTLFNSFKASAQRY